MSSEQNLQTLSKVATAVSLAAKQYFIVDQTTAGLIELGSAGDDLVLGVLQDNPVASEVGRVAYGGRSKVVLGATVAIGVHIASDAAGKAVEATIGQMSIGTLLLGGADTEIGEVLLDKKEVHA